MKVFKLIVTISREFIIAIFPAKFGHDLWATPRRIIANLEAKVSA